MRMRITRSVALLAALTAGLTVTNALTACSDDAEVVSKNLSKDADNFRVPHRRLHPDDRGTVLRRSRRHPPHVRGLQDWLGRVQEALPR